VKFVAESNHSGHRSNRNKPGWNNRVADQSVEKGGFAPLKLADTSYIKTSLGNALGKLTCFLGNRLSPKFLGQSAIVSI
jgi:hypothetical protein